jgi:hypothetical protein
MARSPLDKIHSLNAVIESLDGDIDQVRAELGMLEHIDDDAQRDAAVSEHAEDRQDARMTASDVARMSRHIDKLEAKRAKTARKRDAAVDKLQSG